MKKKIEIFHMHDVKYGFSETKLGYFRNKRDINKIVDMGIIANIRIFDNILISAGTTW